MANHGTVPNPNPAIVEEFAAAVITSLPPNLNEDQMQYWIRRKGRKGELGRGLSKMFVPAGNTLAGWERFLDKYFGMKLDLHGPAVPEHRSGFDRVIVVPQGLTLNRTVEVCRSKLKVYTYRDDLDGDVTVNDRTALNGTYAIRVRDRVEADEELKNLSADDLAGRSIAGITLLERLVLELKYYDETGKHPDIQNWTLCSGSRHSGGAVPCVYWSGGGLCVDWCPPRRASSGLRAREVVS